MIAPAIGIYQPYYKPTLLERLDRGFIALDWQSNPRPGLRELALHEHVAANNLYEKHRLTGLLSPKFFAKTGFDSGQVYAWVDQHPGHEIYLISGGCHVPYIHFNGVVRNQQLHCVEFEERLRSLCEKIGFPLPAAFPRQTNLNRCGCNYWIASSAFWRSWTADVIEPIFELINRANESDEILSYARHAAPAPVYVLTFIYERLIDYYIEHRGIDALYYPWNAQTILALGYDPAFKAYLESMIPLVDRIDATGRWSDSDRAWLQRQYQASAGDRTELVVTDPADYDLPRSYPT